VLGYNAKAYEEALGAISRSLELNPNSATAYNSSGWIRLYLDQPDVAEEHFRRAIRLSPVDPERGMATTGLAVSFLMREQYSEALRCARQAVREMPQYPSAHKVLIQALVLNGLQEDAQAAAARFPRAVTRVHSDVPAEDHPVQQSGLLQPTVGYAQTSRPA
jgi:adenylate cyclase